MPEAATCGTYQDVEAALAALATDPSADEADDDMPAAVQQLHLSCCDIDDAAVGRIAAAIGASPGRTHLIESVNLGWNEIEGTESLRLLVQSLIPLTGIAKLDLNYNSISDGGARHVAELVQGSSSLKFLDLVKNSINAPGSQALAAALGSNDSLTALHLGMNSIGDEGLMHLAGALQTNHTLLTLDVESNKVGPDGVKELAEVLTSMNDTLTAINLQDNEICDAGAEALAKVLETSESLKMLDIRSNGIGCDGCYAIACSLRKSLNLSLDLDLRLNSMDSEINDQFQQLALSNCEIQVAWDFEGAEDQIGASANSAQNNDADSHFEREQLDGESYGQEPELPLAEQTVDRMLGIMPDEDDIAFDNATWYLQKQPELAAHLWSSAVAAYNGGDSKSMLRCTRIFHLLLEQSLQEHQLELLPAGLFECCKEQLPLLQRLLSTPPTDFVSVSSTFGVVEERFGLLRLSVLELVADLTQTLQLQIIEALCDTELFSVMLDHFFNYTWNSSIHYCVLRIAESALASCDEQTGEPLLEQACACLQAKLFGPTSSGGCNLLSRIIVQYESQCGSIEQIGDEMPLIGSGDGGPLDSSVGSDNLSLANEVEAKLVQASRGCGYLGALIEMALMVHNAPNVVQLAGDAQLAEQWHTFDTRVLYKLKVVRDECLGGVPPTAKPQGCGQM